MAEVHRFGGGNRPREPPERRLQPGLAALQERGYGLAGGFGYCFAVVEG
jgi:hypothetical protein